MGSLIGVMKVAAAKAGVSLEEYQHQVASGNKWCGACRSWHPRDAFSADRSRSDGLAAYCSDSQNIKSKNAYVPKPRPTPGRNFVAPRDGDKKQARRRINFMVETSLIPSPNSLPCTDCGHIWSPSERRHEYDHHQGYAGDHHEHVEAVCSTCHHEREKRRLLGGVEHNTYPVVRS